MIWTLERRTVPLTLNRRSFGTTTNSNIKSRSGHLNLGVTGLALVSNVAKPPQDGRDIWSLRPILPPTLPQEVPHSIYHPNLLRVLRLGGAFTRNHCVDDPRLSHLGERPFTRQDLIGRHAQSEDVRFFGRNRFIQTEPRREEFGSHEGQCPLFFARYFGQNGRDAGETEVREYGSGRSGV